MARTFACPGPIPGMTCGVLVETDSKNKARCDKCAKVRLAWTNSKRKMLPAVITALKNYDGAQQ
jgi:hypothetical protein